MKNKFNVYMHLSNIGLFNWVPSKLHLRIIYRIFLHKRLNINNPKTFNEKLQWLKIYDRKECYTKMVDKYEVKQYISNLIGEKYLIPTIGVYDSFDKINFELLPEQFVIKCTHDSGGIVIVKNKKEMDYKAIRKKINRSMRKNYYYLTREWPYKNVKPRIIIEKYMTDDGEELADYKVHNFNGNPKLILVCKDRFDNNGMTEDFFDENWKHLDIKRPGHNNSSKIIEKPVLLNEMLELSKKISEGIPFVRTDFYIINGNIYFGEITFFPASGLSAFIPEKWDEYLGDYLSLPKG